jgi:hypothetical protein
MATFWGVIENTIVMRIIQENTTGHMQSKNVKTRIQIERFKNKCDTHWYDKTIK